MKKFTYSLLFLFSLTASYSQENNTITIGLLSDVNSDESAPFLDRLKEDIRAVIGQSGTVVFEDVLTNGYDLRKAEENYQMLLRNETDIILSFGVIDNLMLSQDSVFPKPVIIFGSVNRDFLNLPIAQRSSAINNLTYLIAPFSYSEDLDEFAQIHAFKRVAILVDEFMLRSLPMTELFNSYFSSKPSQYSLVPIVNNSINPALLDGGVDAVYVAGGFHLNDTDFRGIVDEINSRSLASFSSIGIKDVERGVLATSQPETNIDQFFRRLALNVEAISSGTNASELPMFLEYRKLLTVNATTAKEIGFPLRYSMIGAADIIGDNLPVQAGVQYSIVDIMNGVVGRNLSLNAERMEIELDGQDVALAKSDYLPDADMNATGVYLDPRLAEISLGRNPELSGTGSIDVNQLVYSAAANANIDIQKSLVLAQTEVYNAAELDAILNGAIAYLNALVLKSNVLIQNQNLQLTKQNLRLAEANFEAGAAGRSDILRFRSQMAQNSQSLIEASNQLNQAYYTINLLLNKPISTEIDVADAKLSEGIFKNYGYEEFLGIVDDPQLRQSLIAFLTEEAKINAPELKNLNYNFDVANRSLELNSLERFLPTVALQGQYNLTLFRSGVGSTVEDGFPRGPDGNYNFGLNVGLPLFQRNQRNIYQQTARIQMNQLAIQRENFELNIERNINDLVLDMVGQITNIDLSKISEEAAKESLDITQNAYSQRAVPLIQLIDAQSNYLQSQLASATANYNYILSSIQLERAIGQFFLLKTEADYNAFILRAKQYVLNNK